MGLAALQDSLLPNPTVLTIGSQELALLTLSTIRIQDFTHSYNKLKNILIIFCSNYYKSSLKYYNVKKLLQLSTFYTV